MKTCQGSLALVLTLTLAVWWNTADADFEVIHTAPSKLHVLTIGSNYSSSAYLTITGGDDAQALAGVFKAGSRSIYGGAAGVVEVVNDAATKEGILQAVSQAATYLGPGDTFVFFFSGHAMALGEQTYLVPHDSVMSDENQPDPRTLIASADLQAALDSVRARRLFLFDSDYHDIVPDTRNTHVFLASGPQGGSTQGWMYGAFTAVVLQALQGWADANQDGRVSVFELAAFVGRRLPASTSDLQIPVIRLYGPDFPLVGQPGQESAPAVVALADKLDANLVDLIRIHEAEGIDGVKAYGARRQMEIPDGLVEVIVNAVSMDGLTALKDEVVRLGGSVQTEFENVLYATLPVAALEGFVMQEAVWRMDWSRPVFDPK